MQCKLLLDACRSQSSRYGAQAEVALSSSLLGARLSESAAATAELQAATSQLQARTAAAHQQRATALQQLEKQSAQLEEAQQGCAAARAEWRVRTDAFGFTDSVRHCLGCVCVCVCVILPAKPCCLCVPHGQSAAAV